MILISKNGDLLKIIITQNVSAVDIVNTYVLDKDPTIYDGTSTISFKKTQAKKNRQKSRKLKFVAIHDLKRRR